MIDWQIFAINLEARRRLNQLLMHHAKAKGITLEALVTTCMDETESRQITELAVRQATITPMFPRRRHIVAVPKDEDNLIPLGGLAVSNR